ncbi:bacteriohemerythrin [Candidatus Parabeggiatoa sp. HSG14]|uniref:bacteriohemerythrin n=1 Tax=Candidatus Parabeggiatoa sp. HSG14 TaxID=3055593 RepID=UPI0025A823FF|nr:bacteriohemerythrin [Thiotrichales bacterium HSG14]
MLKKIKISQKIALMMMIPILGLVYFTIDSAVEKREIVNQMDLLQELSEFAVNSSSLIHELQKERGLSAGFIGSRGIQFLTELQKQRINTDHAIKQLDDFVAHFNFKDFSHEIKINLDIIRVELGEIESKRKLINRLNFSVKEELEYYTHFIDSLLIGINHLSKAVTNAELANKIVAYFNLLQAKEKAGIERATLSNVFGVGYFAPDMYKKFISLVSAQDIYLKNFFFFATPSQKQLYLDMQNNPFVKEIERIRKIAVKKTSNAQFIAELYAYIGYDGLIHKLNDYILWGEVKYIVAFHKQYRSAYTLLKIYKNLPYVSQSELKNLKLIENTFYTYKEYLATAIALKNKQKSIEEINAIIKIDEAQALNALNNLLSRSRLRINPTDWWKVATGKINLLKTIEDHISYDLKVSALALKKEAQSIFVFYFLIAGETIILTFLLSYFFARGITIPLKSLVNVANQISSGDRNISIQVDSTDEIGDLSNAMAHMLDSINHSEVILKKTNQAYARFVPNEFLQLLNKNQITDIQLGNHLEMNMTVLFSDIRSFTALSEKMSPQANLNFVNAYLKEMSPIIREHGGLIDKYIGDAIMALFTNADDALNASITMLKRLTEFNQTRQHQQIKIGIGLNTGKLMLGIVGEQNRLQCTVISDAVNLASRLENLTKTYKNSLIISQNTLDNLTDSSQYAIRFLDNLKVKGRSERVNIFGVLDGDPKEAQKIKLTTLKIFEEAVSLYQKHQFHKVEKLMRECLRQNPDDVVAAIYIQRCQNFLKIEQSEKWEEIARKVEWTPDLLIDNKLIDEQHKELFIRTKNLIMSIGSGNTEEEVVEMLNFLKSYVATHFEIEEMYMELYNYSNYAFHKEQHTQFIETFNRIKNHKDKWGHLYLALHIQHEIADWLVDHISIYDKELGLFLKDKS